jgi:spore coat polysaccharide biosynthesis predicted glycosyltransferase SpsG
MKALFITNAGPDIGGGHLSRCLALSQALESRGVACSWILNENALPQASALGMEGIIFLRDIFCRESINMAQEADFVIVDSYLAPRDFFRGIARTVKLVAIDDLNDRGAEFFASVVVNYGFGASRELYGSPSPECRYLLGPGYALLRKEYWTLVPEDGGDVLFVPGAADVAGTALDIAGWWGEAHPPVAIALGPLVPESRCRAVSKIARGRGNVKIFRAPDDFPAMLSRAGFVICTASVTAYEALAMKKKTAVFFVAANQDRLGGLLAGMGAAYNIGKWGSSSREKIGDAISFVPDETVLRGIVNPRGAVRCAQEIISACGGRQSLRGTRF